MQKHRISTNIRAFSPVFWGCLLSIQAVFVIISLVSRSAMVGSMGAAMIVPMILSIPLLVLSILEIVERELLFGSVLIFTIADIAAILIYTIGSFIWSAFAFTMASFAEGYGTLPYAMAVNTVYIFIVPVISFISIIILIITCKSCKSVSDPGVVSASNGKA